MKGSTDWNVAAKQVLKKLAEKAVPKPFAVVQAIRSRRLSHRLCVDWGQRDIGNRLKAELGKKVQSGPFSGIVLPNEAFKEHIGPFLLGTYESELHAWVAQLMLKPFSKVIDVGSKFGYYAVGFNVLGLGQPPAIAFDIDPWARKATLEMAKANSAEGVTVKSFCTRDWLIDNVRDECLVISDCEGYESQLFTGTLPGNFAQSTFLIETHDGLCPGVTAAIRTNFEATHDCREAENGEHDIPSLMKRFPHFTEDVLRESVNEMRGQQKWLLLTPRSEASLETNKL
jgi:hypothetical protein